MGVALRVDAGVLGGTFDPIHNGHLKVAEVVKEALNLAIVLFVPTSQPWWKTGRAVSAPEHRQAMVRLAIAGTPYFRVSTIEVQRGGPIYTVDTLRELRRELGPEVRLFLILGCDSLSDLPLWREPSRVVQQCRLVAVPRPGCTPPDIGALEKSVPGISQNVVLLKEPLVDISATAVRRRVAEGLPIDDLVPQPVEQYIREHRLYAKA